MNKRKGDSGNRARHEIFPDGDIQLAKPSRFIMKVKKENGGKQNGKI